MNEPVNPLAIERAADMQDRLGDAALTAAVSLIEAAHSEILFYTQVYEILRAGDFIDAQSFTTRLLRQSRRIAVARGPKTQDDDGVI